jgi:hypothetical protein
MGPTLGGTHTFFVCGTHNSIVGFKIKIKIYVSHSVSEKDLNNDF